MEADLERVRQRGYALDDEERELGLRCVGTAIFDRRGLPTFALSICGPASRMTETVTAAMGRDLVGSAARISRQLGSAGRPSPFPVDGDLQPARSPYVAETECRA